MDRALFLNLVLPTILVVAATVLAMGHVDGWGWFLFVAALLIL